MTSLDFTNVQLVHLITHGVGNKLRDEELILSDTFSDFDAETEFFLLKYFLQSFKTEEIYKFSHSVSLDLNEVSVLSREMFADQDIFVEHSVNLAKLLYESSMHPKIKAGEFNIGYFKDVHYDGEKMDAIGLFKSESDVPFLKMKRNSKKFSINFELGFDLKSMDKGCLILNAGGTNGPVVLIAESQKISDAQYWKDEFLQAVPVGNEFQQTNQFLNIARQFVTKQLNEEFEVSKADQIDLLNRSVDYFKTHDTFEKEHFEKEVFFHDGMIDSFRKFDESFREQNSVELADSFEISTIAVKKQARVFKNVLKLDKNFHIYIHGNKELIEQGVEKDGRKYYKIYYSEERFS